MAYDPDDETEDGGGTATLAAPAPTFDPDAWLSSRQAPAAALATSIAGFDPDGYLSARGMTPAPASALPPPAPFNGPPGTLALQPVPDDRFADGQPLNPAPDRPTGLVRAGDDLLTTGATAGGNLLVGLPRFVQSERAQYLDAQPQPLAPMTPEQMEARRAELTADLADLADQEAHQDSAAGPSLPSGRENAIRAELAQLTPQAQVTARSNAQAAQAAHTSADALGAAQKTVQQGLEGPLAPGEKPPLDTRISEGVGSTIAALAPFGVGMASIAAQASNSARDQGEAKARAQGLPDDAVRAAGDAASNQALATTAATLPAYMVAGAAASRLGKFITPESAGAARKFVTEATGATAANVAAGVGVRAGEKALGLSDEPVAPTMEGFFGADLPFALSHAAGAAFHPAADIPVSEATDIPAPGIKAAPENTPQLNASPSTGADANIPGAGLNADASNKSAADAKQAADAQVISAVTNAAQTANSVEAASPLVAQALRERAARTVEAHTDEPTEAAAAPAVAAFDPDAYLSGKAAPFDPDEYLAQKATATAATDSPVPSREPVAPVYAAGDTPQERADNFLDLEGTAALPTAARFEPGEAIPPALDAAPRTRTPDGATVVYDPETHQPEDFTAPVPGKPAAEPSAAAPDPSRQPTVAEAMNGMGSGSVAAMYDNLAARVNAGAASEADSAPPSTTFQILARMKQGGAEINPDVARDVAAKTLAITEDAATDGPAKQAALKQLVRDNLPASPADGLDAATMQEAYGKLTAAGMTADEAARQLAAVETARDADDAVRQAQASSVAEEKARTQYEADLQGQASEGLEGAGAVELLKAVRDAGGLPTADPVLGGELQNIRDASKPAALANYRGTFNLFRQDAPKLDELVTRLQEQGFAVDTPADLLQAVQERLETKRPVYGFAARAEAQSGMAGSEAYFRRQTPAAPRTPEELRPLQQRWTEALQRLAPRTATRLEVVRQRELESLWPKGAPRTTEGGSPHAAFLDRTIFLSADALKANSPQINRVNLLHELTHSYEQALPTAERQALRAQWQREMKAGNSPLHGKDGALRPDVDPRAATDFSEWLAERVAWENEGHYSFYADPAQMTSPVRRFAARLRALVVKAWRAVAPGTPPSELSANFRQWLTKGGKAEMGGTGGAEDGTQFTVRHDPALGPLKKGLPPGHPLLTPTAEIETPLRARQREAWTREILRQGRPVSDERRPVLYLMAGGSGSGKSAVLRRLFASGEIPREGTVRLDSDEIKKVIPEYNTLLRHGDAAASTVAHRESANVLNDAFQRTLDLRSNAVLDGTLSYAPHVEKIIQDARAHGYEVRMEGVAIHPDEAIRRAAQRGKDEGRMVPTGELLPRHEGFLNNVERYAPAVDGWRLWDNNAVGADAEPMAEKRAGGIKALDPEKYATFQESKSYDFQEHLRRAAAARDARNARRAGGGQSGGQAPDGGLRGGRGARPAGAVEGPEVGGPGAVGLGSGDLGGAERETAPPYRGEAGSESGGEGPVKGPQAALRQTPAPEAKADDEVTQAKAFLASLYGVSVEHIEQNWGFHDPQVYLSAAKSHGFRPVGEAETITTAPVITPNAAPVDLSAVAKAAEGNWKVQKAQGLWTVTDGAGKKVGAGLTQSMALSHVMDQHGWEAIESKGKWYAQDSLGTSYEVPAGGGKAEAQALAVGKALGEAAVRAHLDKFPAAAKAKPQPKPIMPPPDPATRTRQGRKLPPGLSAPADPADVPDAARLEEARAQAAAVPEVRDAAGKLLAPDGKPSILDEGQWRQVRTPGFKGFFGDWQKDPAGASKVVGPDGEPAVMYRSTGGGLEPAMRPNARRQIYLSESPAFADGYGSYQWEVFADARQPWDYQNPDHLLALRAELQADPSFRYDATLPTKDTASVGYQAQLRALQTGKTHAASVNDAMRDAALGDWTAIDRFPVWGHLQTLMARDGYDGVWITEGGARNLIVPDNTQVKSATHNAGTFDPAVGDTRFAVRQGVQGVRNELEAREAKDRLAAGKDAGETRAGMVARQAGNRVRLDVPDARDREALPFVIEAQGDRRAVAADLAKVQASADPKLAAKYEPVLQHALDHFPRLDALKAGFEAVADKQRAIERRNGIQPADVAGSVARRLDLPGRKLDLEPTVLGEPPGGSQGARYAAKGREFPRLADAIRDGYAPRSTDAADLLEHRIGTGQQMVQQARLFAEMRATPAPGDAAGRPIVGQLEKATTASGKSETRIPLGYDAVDTGGGQPLIVHRQYAGLFRALYGDSAIRNGTPGRLLLKYAALAKHGTLIFDTFHACRLFAKELSYGYQAGYRKGLSILEYSNADLARAVQAGDLTHAQAAYARANRPQAEQLLKAGLNVGRVSDNLMGQAHGLIDKLPLGIGPGLARFNDWVFGKLSRGAMLQTALTNYSRNLARFPELGQAGAARKTAREMNEVFGNLQSQGIFKGATMRDLTRVALLAPQWTESQLRAEGRGLVQLARVPLDLARGRVRVGVVAQGMASNVAALLLANQLANFLSRGQATWQNPEKDHKLDAFIPGGAHGFWFSPFEIAAENAHALLHYQEQGASPLEAAARLASNKLSPLARGASELLTGKDGRGQPFASTTDRLRAAATDALPFPLPVGPLIEKDPRGVAGSGPVTDLRSAADKVLSPLGYRVSRQPGALEKQGLQMLGLKTSPAQSPRSQMFEAAKPFRAPGPAGGAFPASPYTELRRALDNNDTQAAADELRQLVRQGGKSVAGIGKALGLTPKGGVAPERFTGSRAGEQAMLRALTPPQRRVYEQAQHDHVEIAHRFQKLAAGMGGELRPAAAVR